MIPISKPIIGEAEKKAVLEVLESGMLVQGARAAALEDKFKGLCQTKHAIATSSGTTALHIALLAHGIKEGDEVITTPFTFMASVNSILYVGAKPVFVDIDAETFNIDTKLIEKAITPKTKAIIPVHLYGNPCKMDDLLDLANKHHLVIIEDACQSVGASYKRKMTGSFGTGCFSLYATKNIMCGEGGMITTNDDDVAHLSKMLRNHGMEKRYHHDMLGYNFRISDLHAAIGMVQFDKLSEWTAIRKKNASFLNAHIKSVVTPKEQPGYDHVWHQYTIRVDKGRDRDAAVKQLNDAGIGTGIFYPFPAYRHPYMVDIGYGSLSLPVTEQICKEVISLPVHPSLTAQDLETIAAEVNRL